MRPRVQDGAVGVWIRFALTHTRISRLNLNREQIEPGLDLASQRLYRWTFGDPGKFGKTSGPTRLFIDFEHEPPLIVDADWVYPGPELKAAPPTPSPLRMAYRVRECQILGMRGVANRHPGASSFQDRVGFFLKFDMSTLPGLLDQKTGDKIESLKRHLHDRLVERTLWSLDGDDYTRSPKDNQGLDGHLEISALVCKLFCEEFDASRREVLIDDYFESFACGDLSIGKVYSKLKDLQTHGGPNGAAYLYLAEAALYFIDHEKCNDRRMVWTQALATFVRTAEIFVNLYWDGGCRRFKAYGAQWREDNEFSPERRRRLRVAYETACTIPALRQRFNSICAFAFRDFPLYYTRH